MDSDWLNEAVIIITAHIMFFHAFCGLWLVKTIRYIYGLALDCSNSSALVMELWQSGAKPYIYIYYLGGSWWIIPFTNRQQCMPLMFSLVSFLMGCWTNSGVASDLRHHDIHLTYCSAVMFILPVWAMVSTMPVDASDPCITRASAGIICIM